MRLKSTANRSPASRAEYFSGDAGGRRGRSLDEIMIETGQIAPGDIPDLTHYQQQHGGSLADAAVALGKIDVEALQAVGGEGFAVLPPGDERVDPLVRAAFDATEPDVAKVRAVRSRILSSLTRDEDLDRPILVAVAGIGAGDETSLLSANLATVFAQLGSDTLLIDGGLDRPTMHTLFRVSNDVGVTNHLEASRAVPAAAKTAVARLSVIPAGPANTRASAYLHRRSLAEVIGQWSIAATLVIVNLPDIDIAATPLGSMLAGFDSVVLVARKGETSVADIRRAIDELDAKSVPLAGSVIG